jgi:cytochrome b subunit of formate dehydrogenase
VLSTAAMLSMCAPGWTGEESEAAACIKCHVKETPGFDGSIILGSVHGKLDCTECHPSDEDFPHPKKRKPVNCNMCHADAKMAFGKGIHAELEKKGEKDLPDCKACHGTHDIYKKADPRSLVNHQRVDRMCLKCHASLEIKARHPNMADPAILKNYENSAHGRGVHLKGLSVSATCTDCHGHHEIRPKSDPASPLNHANVPKTCQQCHPGIYSDFEKSTHGELWKKGDPKGPVCSVCHPPHEVTEVTTSAFQVKSSTQCGNCHKEQLGSYRDTFHGKATSMGYVVAAKCSDCHTAHRNLPKENPDSTVNPAHLKETCGRCHPGANDKFVAYNPHADPHDKVKSPLVYYVDQFMKWLLLGTFLFFGIHTTLWLQRSIVAYFRREHKHVPEGGRYVRRFSRTFVVLHIIVVVSFLGLALTGLPLKYSFSGWARALGQFLGGLEVTRYFHRVFALATFGYFFYNIWFLVREIGLKRRMDLLKGPRSMIPQLRDLVDFLNMLRWFLYLGPRPRLDRWTYFEKFDYFAVFWGVPILGGSGLLLWFPGFFSQFLPGQLFNVATVIHSEEALLATGFIFTFHFYHNHLRLENFPMDTSIFTGKLSLERLKDERPAEYERLVAENRLDEVLTDAPPTEVRRNSKLFGFIALTIGLLLIVAIFVAHFLG